MDGRLFVDAKTKSLAELVNSFEGLKVLVIGEAMLDSYLEGTTGRICREAPVPVVTLSNRTDAPGGAANTAVNIASLGADVTFLSVIGDDNEGQILRACLEKCQVSTKQLLIQAGRQTLAKHRVIAASQMLVRFDQGSTDKVEPETERVLLERLTEAWSHCQAVIISDYDYGIFTPSVIECLTALQTKSRRVVVADSKNLAAYRNVGITACKPNYDETAQLLGSHAFENSSERVAVINQNSERILDITGAQMVAVTLDTEGALLVERGQPAYRTYAQPRSNSKAAGAGDTFVSALTLALAAGANSTAAVEIASGAAAVVVSKDGTSACSATELSDYFSADERYLPDLERLVARIELYRQRQPEGRIVFANGCFDILHPGHIAFLNQAKACGDLLIVAVNTDASVHRLKGEGRPINTLEDRVNVLEALSCIDHIIAFDNDRPNELIKAVRPDIFVKGGDYTPGLIPEAELVESCGGKVEILPYLPDRSTRQIIERIHEVVQAQPRNTVEEEFVTPATIPAFGETGRLWGVATYEDTSASEIV